MPKTQNQNERNATGRLANGLGWFSVGLGLAEVMAPGAVANLIGIKDKPKTRTTLRSYGVRELAAGVGILMRPHPTGWVWGRVAGDMLDLASLGSVLASGKTNKARAAAATAAVLGVTALDIVCGQQLSTQKNNGAASGNGAGKKSDKKITRSIIVGRPVEETYRFWHDFENLPKFMTYLDSVKASGDGRTHWTALGPSGAKVGWDAETVADEPNRLISWRSVDGSRFRNSGTVRFENAPGNRGAMIVVEMEYAPTGAFSSSLAKVLGFDLGQRIDHDLRNFKQILELGEVTQSDASIHSGMHAAQPSNGSVAA